MINYIWAGMMLISVIFGIISGNTAEVSDALFTGGQAAVELSLTLLATMCLWGGLMRIAEAAGLTDWLAILFRPILRILFPGLDPKSPAARAISMNMSANMLGLGNAATPLGLEAMKHLQAENPPSKTASNYMVTFVVLNTASLQIIPTTIAAMRQKAASENPMEIMPAIWITSIISLVTGVFLAAIFNARKKEANIL